MPDDAGEFLLQSLDAPVHVFEDDEFVADIESVAAVPMCEAEDKFVVEPLVAPRAQADGCGDADTDGAQGC